MTAAFVHGNPETAALWGPLFSALAKRGHDDVVALSPPGFGAPVPDGFGATQDDYRTWLVAELESLGGDVDLVGHDWGAGHALGIVAHRPDLVRTWATDCIGLVHPDYVWHDAAQVWQTDGAGEELIGQMLGASLEDRTAMMAGFGAPPAVAAEVAAGQDDTMGACVLSLYRSAVQPAMAELGQRLLATDRPPGLVVVATEDHYAGTPDMTAEMVGWLDAAEVRLDGLGHWWMFDGADAVSSALTEHWAAAGG